MSYLEPEPVDEMFDRLQALITKQREQIIALSKEGDTLREQLRFLTEPTPPKISTGKDLDWEAVDEAATFIAKQCESIAFTPPEATDLHRMRAGYVCNAIGKMAVALKLGNVHAERSQQLQVLLTYTAARLRQMGHDWLADRIHEGMKP